MPRNSNSLTDCCSFFDLPAYVLETIANESMNPIEREREGECALKIYIWYQAHSRYWCVYAIRARSREACWFGTWILSIGRHIIELYCFICLFALASGIQICDIWYSDVIFGPQWAGQSQMNYYLFTEIFLQVVKCRVAFIARKIQTCPIISLCFYRNLRRPPALPYRGRLWKVHTNFAIIWLITEKSIFLLYSVR